MMDFLKPVQTQRGMLSPIGVERIPTPSLLPRDDDIIELLRSNDFDIRLQTLNRLSAIAKRDPQWFPKFVKKGDLFKQFDRLLVDDRWEVQHQCIKFLLDAIPTFGNNVEWCVSYLLPRLIMKLGSSKITVRRVTNQMLTTYLKLQPDAVNIVQRILINFLLNRDNEPVVVDEVLNEISNLLIPECRTQNWSILIDGLTKWMLTSEMKHQEKIAHVLANVNAYLRSQRFEEIISGLPNAQKSICEKYRSVIFEKSTQFDMETRKGTSSSQSTNETVTTEKKYRFGIVPTMVSNMLINDAEAATRIAGLEQTKIIIEQISAEDIRKFVPHLHSYFVTLGNVLDDLNFKVVVLCLDVVRLTVERLNGHIAVHEQQIVSIISKHFGNQKAVIKQLIMNICMNLMQNATIKSVIALLCAYLDHKNSRIREEIINIITAALLTFNASKMNLSAIASLIAPLLTDPKRRVRLAAFENFAVLANLSSGRIEVLLKIVRDIEHKHRSFGLLNAVTARLSRDCLPMIRYDGLIEYSFPISLDSSINLRGTTQQSEFLDYEWIMSANNGPSSAFSRSFSPSPIDMGPIRTVAHASNFLRAVQRQPSDERKLPWETDNDYKDDASSFNSSLPSERNQMYEDIGIRQQHDVDDADDVKLSPSETIISWQSSTHASNSTRKKSGQNEQLLNGHTNEKREVLNTLNSDSVKKHSAQDEITKNSFPTANGFSFKALQRSHLTNGLDRPTNRAKSDGNILEDISAIHNASTHGMISVGASKNGRYHDEYAPSEPAIPTHRGVALTKKSISHQNLASNTKVQRGNAGTKKPFLKAGSSNRIKSTLSGSNSTSNGVRVIRGSRSSLSATSSSLDLSGRINVDLIDRDPAIAVQNALRKINSDEWTDKVEAIQTIVHVSETAPQAVANNLQPVIVALLRECKNLRSSVSRIAIAALGCLFKHLKTKMDADIEKICLVLMQKAGDVSSAFIRDDATISLDEMVNNASSNKALSAIIASGAKSKNNTIRAGCANLVIRLIERLGATNAISNPDFAKLISVLVAFAKDPSPAVRQHGKHGLQLLSQDRALFDRTIRKVLNDAEVRSVQEVLESIKKRPIDGCNLEASSASITSLHRTGSVRKGNASKMISKVPDSVQLDLDEIRADLSANGWERRLSGLKRFDEMVSENVRAIVSDTKLIEAFIGRLNDINSKVSSEAMQTFLITLPLMARFFSTEASLKAVLNQLVNALMAHLSSRSEEHRQLAQTSLEETIRSIDNAALSIAFSAATKQANVKQKPFMLLNMNKIIRSLCRNKPKQVEVTALPILWELMKSPSQTQSDAELRRATREYALMLRECFGEKTLLEMANGHLNPNQKKSLEMLIK